MQQFAQTHHRSRRLVFDYALGAAIIALVPIPNIGLVKFILLLLLNIKMVRDVGRLWSFPKGIGPLARIGSLFGFLGAIALGSLIWGLIFVSGLFVPGVGVLAPGAAVLAYFWSCGRATAYFYLSSPRLLTTEEALTPNPSSCEQE